MSKKNKILLETNRLILREISKDDKKYLSEILQNPDVILPYYEIFSDNSLNEFMIDNLLQYKKNRVGIFAVIMKCELKFIGIIGVKKVKFEGYDEIYELSFALKKNYWGKGYAFEGVSSYLEYVESVLDISEVFACIQCENSRAIRLIKKLNFLYVSQYSEGESIYIWYKVNLKKLENKGVW
jgi:RimJ/RimL family protein N-acetyltransferase